jgi:hypothetical protein
LTPDTEATAERDAVTGRSALTAPVINAVEASVAVRGSDAVET